MRKSIVLIALFLSAAFVAKSQNCFKYFPQKEGTIMETKYYDKKGTETSTSKLTILKKTTTGTEEKLNVRIESTAPKQDSAIVNECIYTCKDGVLYVDMTGYLGNQLSAYKGMQCEINADKLEIPSKLVEGQELKGGAVQVKVNSNGITIANISVTVSERKVEKSETIKTPAGEFKCFKITQKAETKVGFIKVKTETAEWISEDTGVVRTETYDKKKQLTSYSVLNKLTK